MAKTIIKLLKMLSVWQKACENTLRCLRRGENPHDTLEKACELLSFEK